MDEGSQQKGMLCSMVEIVLGPFHSENQVIVAKTVKCFDGLCAILPGKRSSDERVRRRREKLTEGGGCLREKVTKAKPRQVPSRLSLAKKTRWMGPNLRHNSHRSSSWVSSDKLVTLTVVESSGVW